MGPGGGGKELDGWGHLQGAVHMAAARLSCKWTMGGPTHTGCMSTLRKRYSDLSGGSFLAGKASWSLSRCLPTESADYCMFVNEWAWLRSQVCLLSLKVHLGSILELRQK